MIYSDDITTGNIGVGTTSPWAKLTVWGEATTTPGAAFAVISQASTTLLSLLNDGTLSIDQGAIYHDAQTGITSIDNLQIGSADFGTEVGSAKWADLEISTTSATVTAPKVLLDAVIGVLSDGVGSCELL